MSEVMFEQSAQIEALLAALSAFQAECTGAGKGGKNPHLRNTYTRLEDAWAAARGPLSSHGLSVTQWPCPAPDGHVGILTVLGHASGQWQRCVQHMPVSVGKGTTAAQAVGSAQSYARRYALLAVLGLPSVDDAGEGTRERPSKQQAAKPSADVSDAALADARAELSEVGTPAGLKLWAERYAGLPRAAKAELYSSYTEVEKRVGAAS